MAKKQVKKAVKKVTKKQVKKDDQVKYRHVFVLPPDYYISLPQGFLWQGYETDLGFKEAKAFHEVFF